MDIALEGLPPAPVAHPFGLAGLEGFFHHFVVIIRACDGYLDRRVEPPAVFCLVNLTHGGDSRWGAPWGDH